MVIENAVKIHDEPEYVNFADSNPDKNLAAHIRIDIGDVNKGFAEADEIFEAEYEVPKVQQAHSEPHVCVTDWEEDDRLVIRTATHSYFSHLTDAETFQRLALVETQRRGVETSTEVAFVSDGAEWLQKFAHHHRPDAVRILDFPHAGEPIAAV